jgi:hypothetical protein
MTSAEYRDFAEYCMDLAERASPSTSMKLHQMAEIWFGSSRFCCNLAPAGYASFLSQEVALASSLSGIDGGSERVPPRSAD